jgi:beta-glucanase (GH16 family)
MNPLALLLILLALAAQKPDPGWMLTLAEEFNGSELDLLHWAPHDPWGRERDRQLQAWTPDSVVVSGGQLHLIARRATEDKPVRYDGKEREYVSGIVSTFGTFAQTYGRFEIRCRVPAGRGLRSRFALYPVPLSPLPRIQVFEISGNRPGTISFANFWGTEQTERSFGDSFSSGPDLSAGFHTVAVEWDARQIAWFVDGKETLRAVDGMPKQQMFLLLELAVGGGQGNLTTRFPDETTQFPASFDIDYVRVYRRP